MHFCKIAGRLFCFPAFVRDFSVYRHFLRIFKQTNKIVEKNLWRNAMNIYESIKAAISVQDYTTRKKKEDMRHERRNDADLAL